MNNAASHPRPTYCEDAMGLLDKVFDRDDDDKDRKRAEAARPASAANPAPRFDDVRTGSSSTAPAPGAPTSSARRTYTVVAGDSLSKIAKREYGDGGKWP